MGYEVYTSHRSVHRNIEIYSLVWGLNPFIKGHVDEPETEPADRTDSPEVPFIQAVESSFGVFGTGNTTPRLYREHMIIPELRGKTIVHLQCITAEYDPGWLRSRADSLLEELGIDDREVLDLKILTPVNPYPDNFLVPRDTTTVGTRFPGYVIGGIMDHCDVIASCENYITVHSGGASLASAVGNPNTWVIMNESLRAAHSVNHFIYPNQKYVF